MQNQFWFAIREDLAIFIHMDNEILNEESVRLKRMSNLAQQRLDIQREEVDVHKELLDKYQTGFEIMFRNMIKMEERLDKELERLKGK